MFRKSVHVLAAVILIGAVPARAVDNGFVIGASWGQIAYHSSSFPWSEASANKLSIAYDFGEVPVQLELARFESDRSTFDYLTYCGCVVGGIPPDNREFSAWQLSAGYRLWTHRGTGSALSLRGGLFQAESRIFTGSWDRYTSTGYMLGAGGTFMATPAVGVRVDWEYLRGLEDVERFDASQVLAGLVVKFGGYPR